LAGTKNYPDNQDLKVDSQKVDQLIDLAVGEVLKNDDLLLDYVASPDIWLDDKLPGLLRRINEDQKLIPMKLPGSEYHIGFLMGLRNAFRDKMDKMRIP
jgi:hypothetical protein